MLFDLLAVLITLFMETAASKAKTLLLSNLVLRLVCRETPFNSITGACNSLKPKCVFYIVGAPNLFSMKLFAEDVLYRVGKNSDLFISIINYPSAHNINISPG